MARRTDKTPPRRTASRSVTRRSGSPSAPTAGPRTRSFLVPDGVREHFADGHRARGALKRAATGTSCSPPTAPSIRSSPTEIDQMQRRELPAGLGPQPAGLPGRREGHRRARCVGQGPERARAEHSLVARRVGRPRSIEQDDAHVSRARAIFRPTTPGGKNLHFGIREHAMGCDHERAVADRSCGRSAQPSSFSATTRGPRSGCRR